MHEGNVSGANLAAYDYAGALIEKECKIIWILPSSGTFNRFLRDKEQKTHIIGFYGWMSKLNTQVNIPILLKQRIRNIWSLVKIIKLIIKEKPDYIFTNTITFSLGGIASMLTFKKHYWFIHEFGEEDHGIKIFPYSCYGYIFLGFLSNKVIANSQATYNKFSKYINSSKLNICYYPIKPIQNPKVKPEIKHGHIYSFILIGQIAEGKGHLEVLRAFSVIEKEFTNYILNIYGNIVENDYYTKLVEFIESSDLNSRVKFYPNTSEPIKVMAEHDFLMMASRMEAFGKVTFEALSVGTPVIGRNTGGTKELVEDGYNGFLYDDENDLIDKLSLILCNKVELNVFSYNAANFIAERFNHMIISQNLIQTLNLG